jgi:hypothetical protein
LVVVAVVGIDVVVVVGLALLLALVGHLLLLVYRSGHNISVLGV